MTIIENYTFIVAVLTLISTIILGIMNYRLYSEAKKLKKLKNNFLTVLQNALGFIELEKNYSEALAEKSGEKTGSIKKRFRKNTKNRINSDYSGEQRIRNLIEQIEKT